MWHFVVFQPSKCKKTHFQPQIWSIWPIFPNDSESLPKVCYVKRKNSEIMSFCRNSESAGGSEERKQQITRISSSITKGPWGVVTSDDIRRHYSVATPTEKLSSHQIKRQTSVPLSIGTPTHHHTNRGSISVYRGFHCFIYVFQK